MMVAQKLTLARENSHLLGFALSRTANQSERREQGNLEVNRLLKRDDMSDHGCIVTKLPGHWKISYVVSVLQA